MSPRMNTLFMFSIVLDLVSAANIFVAHYSGTVQTLTLAPKSDGSYSLTTNNLLTVGGQAGWMTYDRNIRTIYNSDEKGSGVGVLNAVSASTDGRLSLSVKASISSVGGAHSTLYGPGYIAVAHYQTSSITTYKLPLSSSTKVIDNLKFTMSKPGNVPSRQEAPHPHAIFPDPTGAYLVSPDLGADLIRIFSINKSTGKLTACPSYATVPGTGPRHGTFWNNKILFMANELSNTVSAYTLIYPSSTAGCLTLTRFQTLTTLANNKTLPSGAALAEVHTKDNFLYVTTRGDLSFNPNDSITSFSIDSGGRMAFIGLTSSGGSHPRTFAINKIGDRVVIGNQMSATVVVVKRDVGTGLLGAQVASMRIGSVGTPGSVSGVSAVLWDD